MTAFNIQQSNLYAFSRNSIEISQKWTRSDFTRKRCRFVVKASLACYCNIISYDSLTFKNKMRSLDSVSCVSTHHFVFSYFRRSCVQLFNHHNIDLVQLCKHAVESQNHKSVTFPSSFSLVFNHKVQKEDESSLFDQSQQLSSTQKNFVYRTLSILFPYASFIFNVKLHALSFVSNQFYVVNRPTTKESQTLFLVLNKLEHFVQISCVIFDKSQALF